MSFEKVRCACWNTGAQTARGSKRRSARPSMSSVNEASSCRKLFLATMLRSCLDILLRGQEEEEVTEEEEEEEGGGGGGGKFERLYTTFSF